MNIESGKTARRLGTLIPNPKAKLRDQFHEVCRFKYFSPRPEDSYWQWVVRFLKFHRKPIGRAKEPAPHLQTWGTPSPPQPRSQPDWDRVASGQSRRRGRRDTARTLQASLASVYMAEHRLARLMMKELARLQKVASWDNPLRKLIIVNSLSSGTQFQTRRRGLRFDIVGGNEIKCEREGRLAPFPSAAGADAADP